MEICIFWRGSWMQSTLWYFEKTCIHKVQTLATHYDAWWKETLHSQTINWSDSLEIGFYELLVSSPTISVYCVRYFPVYLKTDPQHQNVVRVWNIIGRFNFGIFCQIRYISDYKNLWKWCLSVSNAEILSVHVIVWSCRLCERKMLFGCVKWT